jgi:hypothetical protein
MFRITKTTAFVGAAVLGTIGGSYWLYRRKYGNQAQINAVSQQTIATGQKDAAHNKHASSDKQQTANWNQ